MKLSAMVAPGVLALSWGAIVFLMALSFNSSTKDALQNNAPESPSRSLLQSSEPGGLVAGLGGGLFSLILIFVLGFVGYIFAEGSEHSRSLYNLTVPL